MRTLSIDLETYSELDIRKAGMYRYAENCQIILFAYAWDDEPVQLVDMGMKGAKVSTMSLFDSNESSRCRQDIPQDVLEALENPDVLKTAYNAAFERTVLGCYLGRRLDPSQWFCTMVQGYTLGLPGGLDRIGKVLRLSEDKQKIAEGKKLIQYFCVPCRPSKVNGGRTRNLPVHDMGKWNRFRDYCIRDVESEREIRRKMTRFVPGERERRLWFLDQRINDNGVSVDMKLVSNALDFDARLRAGWMAEARKLTGLENPNSRQQVLEWINRRCGGYVAGKFDKETRKQLLEQDDLPADVHRLVQLEDALAKTSVRKYEAMKNAVCRDGKLHGMLQFYGANRTGRWAGRLVQIHNLPQNHLEDLDEDRATVEQGLFDAFCMFNSNPADTLSQLIRTAFVAGKGKRFIVADFSAIEARVIAWLADEKWRMETFAKGGDIYCASASQMFKVPVVKHGINGELRAKGKVAELACGYGGGVSALKAFGADKMGMTQEEMEATIAHWRKASPNICQMWRDVEKCSKRAIRTKVPVRYNKNILFVYNSGMLFIALPSGRRIAYVRPSISREPGRDGEAITYEGTAENGGWGRVYTWGGKLVENIVQAIARDCLAEAMLRLDEAGYKIVMHVHDEVILEEPTDGPGSLEGACEIMGRDIPWAPGLLLRADGYETWYYKKD